MIIFTIICTHFDLTDKSSYAGYKTWYVCYFTMVKYVCLILLKFRGFNISFSFLQYDCMFWCEKKLSRCSMGYPMSHCKTTSSIYKSQNHRVNHHLSGLDELTFLGICLARMVDSRVVIRINHKGLVWISSCGKVCVSQEWETRRNLDKFGLLKQ